MKKLEDLIVTYKDFPKEGIDFKDLLGIIQEPAVFKDLILKMSNSKIVNNCEAIIAIDARGFIFGSAISLHAAKPMVVARKPGKLPGEIIKQNYNLEYGESSLSLQRSVLNKYDSFTIVDDLLATGGTVNCVSNLLKKNGKEVLGLTTVVELTKLNGRSKFNFPVESVISFWKLKILFLKSLDSQN